MHAELPVNQAGKSFWHRVLDAGGYTPIPGWRSPSGAPVGVQATYDAVDSDLDDACRRLSADLAVSPGAILLAAHAKIASILTGQSDVVTGYRAARADAPLPCRLEIGRGSWRDLVHDAAGAEAAVLRHCDYPVATLARELRLTGPLFDTVLDLGAPPSPDLPDGVALSASFGTRRLRLRYRTDVMNAAHAARLAGYYLTALRLMAAEPAADHDARSLLSDEERTFQIAGLAGPLRDLPDRRFHELFEERVRQHPDVVVAEHRGVEWTYRELNGRANRVARALRARGGGDEDVVAVVMERDLDWMAAVIGVFKAGCAYLPIEPRFPSERAALMLSQSGCRFALTERGSDGSLRAAASALGFEAVLSIEDLYEEDREDGDLGVPVAPDQLAYLFFTSGSTGQPKGAMVEHDGMVNHLLAKIEDMGIEPGTVVAQTAPQCFDISLWQLLAGPLAGGRTVIVEQPALLDVPRLVEILAGRRVEVLQLVPTHLEVVLSHLEARPRALPVLRVVSATGEALGRPLVERWFASQPDVRLVNAYGLTETSDDTNHEVMDGPPAHERVPLGRPLRNVHISVLDDRLSLVPLGATGEIVFSGVCVGRGYVNDDRRTRQSFGPDPHRPGMRMYRSGDLGRWLPDGKLEYLGRRDAQVKVRGFRIEIGEVEHRLERMAGVRDCAVVATEDAGRGRDLAAFYTAPASLPTDSLRAFLARSLPEYMIPSSFRWLPALPLTGNGKIDRKRLARLAGEAGESGDAPVEPETPAERWMAAAWADVLGTEPGRIGRHDHFFERGGTSLTAVRLVLKLDRRVSLEELAENPVLSDLARLVEGRHEPR